eukprot:CAMPEP_0172758228 /NCGR_PEP_ID=MMETSP1074-20121228/165336_1 /TAXON_ID=2916 /ORGANISM="Ceratium fusus, Strain PA161109" /LENGTH=99 /DNA_ID=CAMNT_0013591777 /DNA_START=31 /DNA_END=327 /DNA_ORIENTATION=+
MTTATRIELGSLLGTGVSSRSTANAARSALGSVLGERLILVLQHWRSDAPTKQVKTSSVPSCAPPLATSVSTPPSSFGCTSEVDVRKKVIGLLMRAFSR